MKALRVNADYETQLFTGGPGPKGFNEALEFLAFFLVDRPILTSKKYSSEFLDYIEEIIGQRPLLVSSGVAENWWGTLRDLEREKWLNSKLTSTELALKNHWIKDTFIVREESHIPSLAIGKSYLVKDPYGMSGRGFVTIQEWNNQLFKNSPLILEPLLKRIFDFSHYVFPDGQSIVYENKVDHKFQFKGSIFRNQCKSVEELSFYKMISSKEWERFQSAKESIISHYQNDLGLGFSIDSFVFEENGELKLYFLSEVNARRTMGLVGYELGSKFAKDKNWSALLFGRSLKELGGFTYLKQKLKPYLEKREVIILSPGDTRFEMLFFAAASEKEGRHLIDEVSLLIPELQLNLLANPKTTVEI